MTSAAIERVNKNPFSAKGSLGLAEFLITVVVTGGLSFVGAGLFRQALSAARIAENIPKFQVLAAAWFFFTVICFWVITTAFVKHWAELRGEEVGAGARRVMRIALLSPLLSIWLLFFTLLHASFGLFDPRVGMKRLVGIALVTLAFFHVGYLSQSVIRGEKQQIAPELNRTVGAHLFPYFSPLTKLIVYHFMDFQRADSIYEKATVGALDQCPKQKSFLNIDIDDCFFIRYLQEDQRSSYSTSIFGFLYEMRYRQVVGKGRTNQQFQPFAQATVTVGNLITLLEPGHAKGRARVLQPLGLLPYLSSPELVMVEVGQEIQQIYLRSKLLPIIKGPITQMEKLLPAVQAQLSPTQAGEVVDVVESLKRRVSELEAR